MSLCHVCGYDHLEEISDTGDSSPMVSSDVRPVGGQARYLICPHCGCVQKDLNAEWKAKVERIYAEYQINHQSRGHEPTIFDTGKGNGPRSLILMQNFLDKFPFGPQGRLLDIGCSNGNLLKSFHSLRPEWRLSGSEIFDNWEAEVSRLPAVEGFYVGKNPQFDGLFDIISMSHVLEHVPGPVGFIEKIANFLEPNGGKLVIAVPDLRENPIDLIIADHSSHFDADSLGYVFRMAGMTIDLLSSKLLPKELVVVASPRKSTALPAQSSNASSWTVLRDLCLADFKLFDAVRNRATEVAERSSNFGIMGSSVAACWLAQLVPGKVGFFVDEDENRIGKELMGHPIRGFTEIPPGSTVFIPMSASVAKRIVQRWRHLGIDFQYLEWNQPPAH